jgi:coenzyme F420-reducing hydrogenase delta subunit
MGKSKTGKRIIIFTCNWHAYSSLENAGLNKMTVSQHFYPIRLACLGRITPGIILKAFEDGVDGVMLLGCPEGQCRHNSGNQTARKVYREAKSILSLLGYKSEKLKYVLLESENGKEFVRELEMMAGSKKQIKG